MNANQACWKGASGPDLNVRREQWLLNIGVTYGKKED